MSKNLGGKLLLSIITLLLVVTLFQISFSLAAPGWYIGDNHDHTTNSDGAQTPTQMANRAKSLGFGYLTITDHNTIAGKSEIEAQTTSAFIGICGDELTRSSPSGHANAYCITSHIDHNLSPQAMIDAVKLNNNRRGFLYINHPCWSPWQWDDWSVTGYTGMEVWNAYYVGNWNESYNKAAFDKWDELNRAGRHLYGMANTDAHAMAELGYGYNMTYATDLTREEILNSLRTGRFYGTNGPQVDFTINELMMGSDVEVPAGGGTVTINLSATYGTSNITSVKLIKNYSATPINTWNPTSYSWSTTVNNVTAQPGDFFRMTVECADTTRFAFSNPIFIKSQGTAVFTDDFNAHSPGTTPDGWTADSSYSIVTDGTSRYQVDAAAADKFASADSARVNYYVQAKCKLTQLKTGANYLGLAARYTDAANNYLFYYNSSESRWKIGRYLAGVWLAMASGPSFTISVGTEYTLKFEIDGDRLTGYVNGVLQCGTTDPALASGKIACYGNNTKGTFDEITVGQYSAVPVATPTPTPVAYITTNKSSYAVGENITVNFYNGPGNAKDWIGLYNNGAPDSPSIKWLYVNGTQTATIGISTGSVTFSGGLTTAGTYNVRFFANDGYTRICDQITFTVGATATPTPTPAGTATPTPTLAPTLIPVISLSPQAPPDSNQTIYVTITNAENPSHSTDWIGLYEANVTPDGDPVSIWWDYLPNLGITNGNGTFTFNPANISSGNRSRYSNGNNYKFILAYDGSYVSQASTSFTVGSR